MGNLFEKIIQNLKGINFEGPVMIVIVLLAFLAVFRKWSILLFTLLVAVLGWGARDLMIMNIKTQSAVVNLSLLIYIFGGVIIILLILYSFYKS
jgi:hypothetical protein